MNILIFGVTGLIGSTLSRTLALDCGMRVFAATRRLEFNSALVGLKDDQMFRNICIENMDDIAKLLEKIKPSVVINCAGITKHLPESNNLINTLAINSIFPHRLGNLCNIMNIRLVHISSDCVFSGANGPYSEGDVTDALDLYGRSKALGEVIDQSNCITLRTSTIGHEIETKFGLLEWFLDQNHECTGFQKAIFSGLTTLELARVIKNKVIPNMNLSGLYNIAAEPIAKYDLLCLIASVYKKDITIIKDEDFAINRSLRSVKFFESTGYIAPKWINMIRDMREAKLNV
jgi:dTDP-4-dehydrorhamnose reductase